jgi:molybdate transport system ATP-binding protein
MERALNAAATSAGLSVRVRRRLPGFTLDVAFDGPGEGVTVLFGPSGAGKSQVLAAVAGASRPDEGRVAIGPSVLFDRTAGVDMPMQRRAVGWVFQDARLFPHLDVQANLLFGARRAQGRPAATSFEAVVEVLGVAPLLRRRTGALSGGERQRVAIGRALLSQPRLLLMDEPLAALDTPRRAEILPYLERLKTQVGVPILYVTHALDELTRLADQVVLLQEGRVLAQGPVNALLGRADLPLLGARADAASAFDAQVREHRPDRGLSVLQAGGAELLAPTLTTPIGSPVRVTVRAREVLLAVERPRGLSARNILPGQVQALAPGPGAGVNVAVRLDGGPDLLAALTSDAVSALALAPGRPVWAIIKSMSVEGGAPA